MRGLLAHVRALNTRAFILQLNTNKTRSYCFVKPSKRARTHTSRVCNIYHPSSKKHDQKRPSDNKIHQFGENRLEAAYEYWSCGLGVCSFVRCSGMLLKSYPLSSQWSHLNVSYTYGSRLVDGSAMV